MWHHGHSAACTDDAWSCFIQKVSPTLSNQNHEACLPNVAKHQSASISIDLPFFCKLSDQWLKWAWPCDPISALGLTLVASPGKFSAVSVFDPAEWFWSKHRCSRRSNARQLDYLMIKKQLSCCWLSVCKINASPLKPLRLGPYAVAKLLLTQGDMVSSLCLAICPVATAASAGTRTWHIQHQRHMETTLLCVCETCTCLCSARLIHKYPKIIFRVSLHGCDFKQKIARLGRSVGPPSMPWIHFANKPDSIFHHVTASKQCFGFHVPIPLVHETNMALEKWGFEDTFRFLLILFEKDFLWVPAVRFKGCFFLSKSSIICFSSSSSRCCARSSKTCCAWHICQALPAKQR